jgi:cell division control protein 6
MVLLASIFETEKKTSSVIKNDEVLSYDYLPKILPYREGQIQEIALSIKPLIGGQRGTNLFVFGAPGIGKTASIKWVLRELEENTDEVVPIYVNCWNLKSKYFIFSDIANQLKISFTQGKSAEHILQQVLNRLKETSTVFVFDEIDKVDDSDFLYQVVSMFPKSSIILVSNSMDYITRIELRIKSRLMLRNMEFKPYSINEIAGILKERSKLALRSESIDPSLIKQIANVTYNKGDIRVGLHILREAAKIAENKSQKIIDKDIVAEAIKQIENTKVGDEEKLSEDELKILEAVKEKNGAIAGEVFEVYAEKGGQFSYRSFKRYIERLSKLGLIKVKSTAAGFKGKSTLISIS